MSNPKAIQLARSFSTHANQPWRPIFENGVYGAQSEDLRHTVSFNPRTSQWTWTVDDEYVTIPCDSLEAMVQDVLARISDRESKIQSEVDRHEARLRAERSRLAAQQRRKKPQQNRWGSNYNRYYR